MALWFKSKHPTLSWLSNFSKHGFELEGSRWASVEHFYQAQKYAGTEAWSRIRAAGSPMEARKAGQDRSLTPRKDWEAVKLEIMRQALWAKFDQNRRLKQMLIDTGTEELVHESSSDLFWGRSRDGEGENQLGQLLMRVRDELG
ncbi:MAG: NADAR family protein [Verrucomicrobiales bacterium]|nr:NADAR family protein [Verrucomicrobiales bacterium]